MVAVRKKGSPNQNFLLEKTLPVRVMYFASLRHENAGTRVLLVFGAWTLIFRR